jgi:alanyl aminopeptidase
LRAEAQKLVLQWLADHKATSPELTSVALHLSAIEADAMLWEKLRSTARTEPDRVERQRILGAMGTVRDPDLAQKNFALFLTDEFDGREALALVNGAGDDPRTREAMWAFVQKSWDAIVARLPKDSAAYLPSVGAGFCDEEHAAALGQFFRPRTKDHAGMERRLAQAMEEVRQCAAFKAKQGPALLSFLKER